MHGHGNHGNHGDLASDDASGTAPADAKASGPAASEPHKCSACAVCCAATATTSAVMALPAVSVEPAVFSAVVASVVRFAVGGPDRPPRKLIVQPT